MRKSIRQEGDFYESPRWAVAQFFDAFEKTIPDVSKDIAVADPFAGRGAILSEAGRRGYSHRYAVEINPVWKSQLEVACGDPANVTITDSLAFNEVTDGLVVTNPPYKGVIEAVKHWHNRAPVVAMLLQVPFLSSSERAAFLEQSPPSDIYRLAHRPVFVWICREVLGEQTVTLKDGSLKREKVQCDQSVIPGTAVCPACGSTKVGPGTNMVEYAWVMWRRGWKHKHSRWHYLPTVPAKERKVEKIEAP
jgi:hypothetical protein